MEARREEDPADEHAPRAFAQVVAREEVAGDPGPGDVADGAAEGAERRGDEKGAHERAGHPGARGRIERAEVRLQDVDDVLARGEADRDRAHVDHPVGGLVERGVAADAARAHDVLHDLLVERRERHEDEQPGRRDERRAVLLGLRGQRGEEVRDDDVHPGRPRPGGEAPEEEPSDERHGLALVAVAEVDEDEPPERGDERDDEGEDDDHRRNSATGAGRLPSCVLACNFAYVPCKHKVILITLCNLLVRKKRHK